MNVIDGLLGTVIALLGALLVGVGIWRMRLVWYAYRGIPLVVVGGLLVCAGLSVVLPLLP